MPSRWGIFPALMLLVSLAGCAPRTGGPVAYETRRGPGVFHTVKPGENLFRIGRAYGVSPDELARLNGIRDARRLRAGQSLFIPRASRPIEVETASPDGTRPRSTARSRPAEETFLWPVSGRVNSGFGPRGSSFHDGLDIAAAEGTPIRAVEDGEVIYSDRLRGYGNTVIIRHGGGIASVYAHNQVNLVREGQQVGRGEIIARVGSTGRVTGPHLHFEIRKNNLAQDPLLYLPELCCVAASDMVAPEAH